MEIDFTKMQGAGNDFVVLDRRVPGQALTPAQIVRLADRRLGVGCDQIILLGPPASPAEDASLRFLNSDGSEAGACGNGTRCAAALLAAETGRRSLRLGGPSGPLSAERDADGTIRVDMGAPRLDWREVPLSAPGDTLHLQIDGDPAASSIGNPHATWFVEDLDAVDVAREGALRAAHALFPHGANIGFAQVCHARHMRLKVWERGAGLTPACGSGACAAVVNAHRRGLVGRDCTVEMPGGVLRVVWRGDGHVLLGGPAETVFTGRIRMAP